MRNNYSPGQRSHKADFVPLINRDHFLVSFFVFSLVLVSVEKLYQTLNTALEIILRTLEIRQKYSAARRIFNSLLRVWKCGQTRSLVFYISHEN